METGTNLVDQFLVQPLRSAIEVLGSFVPQVIGALVLLVIGVILARFIEGLLVTFLKRVGLDKLADQVFRMEKVADAVAGLYLMRVGNIMQTNTGESSDSLPKAEEQMAKYCLDQAMMLSPRMKEVINAMYPDLMEKIYGQGGENGE